MTPLPLVIRADHREGFKIHLVFNDGTSGVVDFEPFLEGPIFEPIRDPQAFARFFIEAGTITWPNGADVAPETLHAHAKTSAAA